MTTFKPTLAEQRPYWDSRVQRLAQTYPAFDKTALNNARSDISHSTDIAMRAVNKRFSAAYARAESFRVLQEIIDTTFGD